jgi:hypothetical protein
LTYKKAAQRFADFYAPPLQEMPTEPAEAVEEKSAKSPEMTEEETHQMAAIYNLDSLLEQKSNEYSSMHDVGSILNESKLDVALLTSNIDDTPVTESAFAIAPKTKPPEESDTGGGNMSPEAIAALLGNAEPEVTAAETAEPEKPESSGGNMSPEAIAALLAANE